MARSGLPLALCLVGILLVGCGSNSLGAHTPLAFVDPTAAPASTPTVDANALSTEAASSPAARLAALLVADGDFPGDMVVRENRSTILQAQDVPGLTMKASGQFVKVVSGDKNEFVTESAIVSTSGDSSSLLDAFNLKNYLAGFTGGAKDAKGADLTLAGAPRGSKAISYSGTVTGGGQQQGVTGESVAFLHGHVFVVITHGTYVSSTRSIDVSLLATTIDHRLASAETTN